MNRPSTIRNLVVVGSLLFSALSVSSLAGCALEDDAQNGETSADELVERSKNDPSAAHTGTTGNLDLQLAPGSGARNTPAVLESGGEGEGPQPQPWVPQLAIRSTNGSSNNK